MMSKKDKISIIIPVYNAENSLDKCITSVLNQTYRNIEIFLINDGSDDNSENKCLEYKIKDQRVRYIKQINQGVSSARNTGLFHCCGDYVTFLDADD